MATSSAAVTTGSGVVAAGVRWSRRLAVAAVVVGAVLVARPGPASDAVALGLVAAGLLAGLPHGAIDHRLAAALTGRSAPLVVACYALLAAGTWVLLVLTGPVALVAVLALSIVHFGLGELEVMRSTTGWRPSRVVVVAAAVAATGALLLPLARAGDQLTGVAVAVSPQLGPLLGAPPVRAGLAAVWLLATAVAVGAALRARHPAVVVDLLLVGALGALAPPLVAFAVWFGGWHALRHTARLLTVEPRCAAVLAARGPRAALRTLLRVAAWPTAAAVVVLAGLLAATTAAADPTAAIGATLLVLLALTVPHMLVVLLLDRHPPRPVAPPALLGGHPGGR
ncbi:MAG: beta-carotene 15,15'-dioxygenase, Brp/Blh family [Pseudonocardiales bacterium]|nr:beta-carotene 15,15'-dioxygenase, Brp/Blh family [Pseudonocardiales bacterium]